MHNFDIEKYINGELKEEERVAIENQLKQDPDLLAEVNRTRELIKNLRLKKLSHKIQNAQRMNRKWASIPYLILALLLISGISYLFFLNTSVFVQHSTESIPVPSGNNLNLKISSDTIQDHPILIDSSKLNDGIKKERKDSIILAWQNPKSAIDMAEYYFSTPEDFAFNRGQHVENLLDSAKLEFNADNFRLALFHLEKLTNDSFVIPYFQALCHFRLGEYRKANGLFKTALSRNPDRQKSQDIEWYYFLNTLACGKPCTHEFSNLSKSIQKNPHHRYSSQVKNILSKKIEGK